MAETIENGETLNPESGEEVNPRKGEDNYQNLFNNSKLTYDKFLDLITRDSHRSSDHGAQMNHIAMQALQNAVENANMLAKNNLTNADLLNKHSMNNFAVATDRMWNLEVTEAASMSSLLKASGMNQATIAAIQSLIVKTVQDTLANMAAGDEDGGE